MSASASRSLLSRSLLSRARPGRHRGADRSPENGGNGRMRSRSHTSAVGRDAARAATLRSRDHGDSAAFPSTTGRQIVDADRETDPSSVAAQADGRRASAAPDTADVRLRRWREVLARKRRAHASRSDSASDGRAARSRSPDSQRFGPQTLLLRCRRRRRPRPKEDDQESASGDNDGGDDSSDADTASKRRDGSRRRSRRRRDNDDDTDPAHVPFARRRRRRVPKCVATDDVSERVRSTPPPPPSHASDGDTRVRNEVVCQIHLQMRHCSNYALDVVCDIIGDYAATSVLSPIASASSVPFLRCASACVDPST